LEGHRLEIVDIFYGHFEYFTDIWDVLWPFGTFCVHMVHFPNFCIMYQEKSGNPVQNLFSIFEYWKWTPFLASTLAPFRVSVVFPGANPTTF
jgi:hypothetical protein